MKPSDRLQRARRTQISRRELLVRSGMGLGLAGLVGVLDADGLLPPASAAEAYANPMAARPPHFPGPAKHVIQLFMNGGPSHLDTFDPKPALLKYAGRMLPDGNLRTERKTGAAFPSPFKFQKFGQSGIEVSEIFPHVAESIDEIAVVRSMHADVPNHEPSLMLMNCGESRLVRPSMGSWVTFGLGTENQNLPGFIAMCPGGYPIKENGETLVIWGGEFGRTPTVELPQPGANAGKVNGRDHNHYGFTVWLAGGGVKGGQVYGATDEFGFQAVEKPVHVHDLQATILHLLGFDHERLTYRHAGRDFRLTDVHGRVVHELVA